MMNKVNRVRYSGIPNYTKLGMNRPNLGFFKLSIMGWLAVSSAVVILFLGVSLKIQTTRLNGEQEAHAKTKAAYRVFVADVKEKGEAAKKKVEQEKKRQNQVSQERVKGYEKRLADINSAYQRLLSESSGSGGRGVRPVPETARSPDAATRDQQLLDVLRYADEQTARLIELQAWIREQGKYEK